MLTYGDLPSSDRTSREVDTGNGKAIVYGVPTFLYCVSCDAQYSATRGDYFRRNDDEPVTCGDCGEPMILAKEQTRIVDMLGVEV